MGILLAIIARDRTGVGQMVEASLLSGQIEAGRMAFSQYLMLRALPAPSIINVVSSPTWNVYLCQDDKWVALSVLQSDKVWPDFCAAIGRPEWEKDPRYENLVQRIVNKDELLPKVRELFRTRPRAEWVEVFNKVEIAAAPVNDFADLENDPQVIANDYVVEIDDPIYGRVKLPNVGVKLSHTPGEVTRLGPELGQHTEEVLMEVLGYSWEEIGKLREAGVY